MSVERVPMTPGGYKKLKEELHKLKTVDRQEVIKAISFARSLGDLSENAEYETAKNKQSFIEGRIQEVDAKIGRAEVIDPAKITKKDRVVFGLSATLEDVESGDVLTYQIVGEDEIDPDNGIISISSPIGRALIGKEIDDDVQVRTPGGIREFIVVDIN
jgi:transcription elongation factor GreA